MQNRRWVFTLNNFTEEELIYIHGWYEGLDSIKYLVFQHECGENGTHHLQGYVVFRRNQRLPAVRALLARGHWEPARGSHEQCVDYSTKGDTRVAGPWISGEHGHQGARSDLRGAVECLRDVGIRGVAEQHPATYVRYWRGLAELQRQWDGGPSHRPDAGGYLFVGEPGTGKSRRVWDAAEHAGVKLYVPLVTDQKVWFNDYCGEKWILLDDWVGVGGVSWLLHVLDVYPLRVDSKFGCLPARWERVYITSNLEVSEWYGGKLDVRHIRAIIRRLKRYEYM